MTPFVKYTLARLGLFVATFVVLWLATFWWLDLGRATIWLVALVALIVSAIASIFVLAAMRDAVAARIQERADTLSQRLEESRNAEDID